MRLLGFLMLALGLVSSSALSLLLLICEMSIMASVLLTHQG